MTDECKLTLAASCRMAVMVLGPFSLATLLGFHCTHTIFNHTVQPMYSIFWTRAMPQNRHEKVNATTKSHHHALTIIMLGPTCLTRLAILLYNTETAFLFASSTSRTWRPQQSVCGIFRSSTAKQVTGTTWTAAEFVPQTQTYYM